MSERGQWLTTNEYLTVGQYLVSANRHFFVYMQDNSSICVYFGSGPDDNHGLLWCSGTVRNPSNFFAIIQSDGNFGVYSGTGPADNHGWLWLSSSNAGLGDYFAIMQDDGNFCVYQGTGPADNHGLRWSTGSAPTLTKVIYDEITYDLANAQISSPTVAADSHQALSNGTSVEQSESVTFSCSYTESSSFTTTVSDEIGLKLELTGGVPLFDSAKLTLSAKLTFTKSNDEASSSTETFSQTNPMVVPPFTVVNCQSALTTASISVPYSGPGWCEYNDSVRLPVARLTGTYNGSTKYDVNTSMVQSPYVSP